MFALQLCKAIEKEVEKKIDTLFQEISSKYGIDRKELETLWKGETKNTPSSLSKKSLKDLKALCKEKHLKVKSRNKKDFVNALVAFELEAEKNNDGESNVAVVGEPNEIQVPLSLDLVENENVMIEDGLLDEKMNSGEESKLNVSPISSITNISAPPVSPISSLSQTHLPLMVENVAIQNDQNEEALNVMEEDNSEEKTPLEHGQPQEQKLDLEKIKEDFEKISKNPTHKMSLKQLKKKCTELGFDIKKKKRNEMIDFLDAFEKSKNDEPDFESYLVDPNQNLF